MRLRSGALDVCLDPQGGVVRSATFGGRALLSGPRGEKPTDAACFPMVPWCDRLSKGGVHAPGGFVKIAPNWPTTPFPVHGEGWLRAWEVVRTGDASANLILKVDGPFSYIARQVVTLDDKGLTIGLEYTNTGLAMPAGLGLHPFFPCGDTTEIRFAARDVTRFDAAGLPESTERLPYEVTVRPSRDVNLCFGETGTVEVTGEVSVRLTATGLPFVHLWAPKGADFVAIEPVSHAVDAFSSETAARDHVLGSGQSRKVSLRVEIL